MSTLSAREVGDLMTIYTVRPCPVSEAFPRINATTDKEQYTPMFDRGHFRWFSYEDSKKLPDGFVSVPERVVLLHYASTAQLDSAKIEKSIIQYRRECNAWKSGVSPRPVRPTLNMLQLGGSSEFEQFLQPLISFYVSRLKNNYSEILNLCEMTDKYDVFEKINDLYLPDTKSGKRTDLSVISRWEQAVTGSGHKYILVRMDNFADLDVEPSVDEEPPLMMLPFPEKPLTPEIEKKDIVRPKLESERDADEKLIGNQCDMGKAFKNNFLIMAPWRDAQLVSNPFSSKEYRYAWNLAQKEFKVRYNRFKVMMDRKRRKHLEDWKSYKLYEDQVKACAYTKTVITAPYVERPQHQNFTVEWNEFIFGLREEMKNFKFEPVPSEIREKALGRLRPSGFSALRPEMLMI